MYCNAISISRRQRSSLSRLRTKCICRNSVHVGHGVDLICCQVDCAAWPKACQRSIYRFLANRCPVSAVESCDVQLFLSSDRQRPQLCWHPQSHFERHADVFVLRHWLHKSFKDAISFADLLYLAIFVAAASVHGAPKSKLLCICRGLLFWPTLYSSPV